MGFIRSLRGTVEQPEQHATIGFVEAWQDCFLVRRSCQKNTERPKPLTMTDATGADRAGRRQIGRLRDGEDLEETAEGQNH